MPSKDCRPHLDTLSAVKDVRPQPKSLKIEIDAQNEMPGVSRMQRHKRKEGLFSGFVVFSKQYTHSTEHVLNVRNPLKGDRNDEIALITKVSKNVCKVELTFLFLQRFPMFRNSESVSLLRG